IAVEPHEPGDCIGRDRLGGVADMGRAFGVGDGRGEVVAGLVTHRSIPGSVVIPGWALPTQRADLGYPGSVAGMTEMAGTRGPRRQSRRGSRPGHDARLG